jgi:hypothetical protein
MPCCASRMRFMHAPCVGLFFPPVVRAVGLDPRDNDGRTAAHDREQGTSARLTRQLHLTYLLTSPQPSYRAWVQAPGQSNWLGPVADSSSITTASRGIPTFAQETSRGREMHFCMSFSDRPPAS